MVRLLILGYSDFSKRRIIPIIINKFKKIELAIASKTRFKKDNIRGVKWYGNYFDAINSFMPDIVYVSTPNNSHYKWGKYVLKKKIHVIIDKPLSLNLSNALELINLSKKNKSLVAESTIFNYHSQFVKALKMIGGKKKISNIQSFFCIPKPKKGNLKLSKFYGGGSVNDMGPYSASIIRLFLNKLPKKLIVTAKKKNNIIEKFSTFIIDKISISSFFSHNDQYMNELILFSEKKRIVLNRVFSPDQNLDCVIKIFENNKKKLITIKKESTFEKFFREYLTTIKNRKYKTFYNKILFDAKIRNLIDNEIRKKY